MGSEKSIQSKQNQDGGRGSQEDRPGAGEKEEPPMEKSAWEGGNKMNEEQRSQEAMPVKNKWGDEWDNRQGANKNTDGKANFAKGAEAEEQKNIQIKNEVSREQRPVNVRCNVCGLKNHATEDCLRRPVCEICGFNNHSSFDCKKEPLWNYGPELCAAQVENQSK
jgi:hypothetical protein